MKKSFLIVLILLMCFGCSSQSKEPENLGQIIEVTPKEIMDKMDNGDTFFLYVTLSTCSVCAEYKNVVNEFIANYNVDMYHIEIDSYTQAETATLSMDYLDNLTDAPDSFVIVDGVINFEKVGIILYRNLKSALKEYNLVD